MLYRRNVSPTVDGLFLKAEGSVLAAARLVEAVPQIDNGSAQPKLGYRMYRNLLFIYLSPEVASDESQMNHILSYFLYVGSVRTRLILTIGV